MLTLLYGHAKVVDNTRHQISTQLARSSARGVCKEMHFLGPAIKLALAAEKPASGLQLCWLSCNLANAPSTEQLLMAL